MANSQNFNQSYSLNQMDAMIALERQNKEKVEKFKTRILEFENVNELDEARELVQKILPVANEKNIFRIGNARCIVVNKSELLRISLDTPNEFIAYDFEQ